MSIPGPLGGFAWGNAWAEFLFPIDFLVWLLAVPASEQAEMAARRRFP